MEEHIVCECGESVNVKYLARHNKTKKHKDNMNKINGIVEEHVLCECGEMVLVSNKERHDLTKKHKEMIREEIPENADNNEYQRMFINSNVETCSLLGNPGCGKTRTIIEYCIEKYKQRIIETNRDFLIVSFSKKAQLDFVERGTKSRVPKLFNSNNVRTAHSLAASIFRSFRGLTSSSLNTIILATYRDILNRSKEDLLNVGPLNNCKFIIVDEAQDINNNQYSLVKIISEKLDIPLIMVGDPNQNIYQFQGGSDEYLLKHSNKVFNLLHNYRSTNQIINFINVLRPHRDHPNMICGKNTNGPKPVIYCESISKILEHIMNEIITCKYKREEIAIIGPVKKSHCDDEQHHLSLGLNMICNYLSKHDIPFIKHFSDNEAYDYGEKMDKSIVAGNVNVLTSHGCKGLEFQKVLVVNYHSTTFTRLPSKSDYIMFKFLWYVTLSRAISELIIYVDIKKFIFPEMKKVAQNYYTTCGKTFRYPPIDYTEEKPTIDLSITEIINDPLIFTENIFLDLEEKLKWKLSDDDMYDVDTGIEILEHNKYSALYGIYIEKLFMYYYYKNKNNIDEFIKHLKNISEIIFVEDSMKQTYQNMVRKGYICSVLGRMNIKELKNQILTTNETNLVNYCKERSKNDEVRVYINNNLFYHDIKYFEELCAQLKNNLPHEELIFAIVVYIYQIDNESKYLMDIDFSNNIISLSHYFPLIDDLSKTYDNMKFQIKTLHKNIKLIGILDAMIGNKIIEFKFVKNVNEKHIMQTLLYYNNYFPKWDVEKDIEIWNFYSGKKYKITISEEINNWYMNTTICDILKIKMTNTVFMLDIETNTKNINDDFTKPTNCEIIDRCLIEYNTNYCFSEGLIKNKHRLTTTQITGITETMMRDADPDLNKFRKEMEILYTYCDEPIFIAHNGFGFDFPILKYNKLLDGSKSKFLDSMVFLRLLVHEVYSGKLINYYNEVFKKNVEQEHRARSDTMMIVEICNELGLTIEDFSKMLL